MGISSSPIIGFPSLTQILLGVHLERELTQLTATSYEFFSSVGIVPLVVLE